MKKLVVMVVALMLMAACFDSAPVQDNANQTVSNANVENVQPGQTGGK